MKFDCRALEGMCSCGKSHLVQTKLCVIDEDALLYLNDYMDELGLRGKRCAIYDQNTYHAVPIKLHPNCSQEILLRPFGLLADEENTAYVLNKLDDDIDVLLAIGGGPLHDIVRYCAKQRGIPFVSIPTAASCDAFSAEVAALHWNGVKKTINCQAPILVVADINVIKNAPSHLVLSGIGDVLGKFNALTEWKIAHEITGEHFCVKIHDMMKQALEEVWNNGYNAHLGDVDACTAVMYGLLLSGIAMQMQGNSRPASGAEHHISYFLDANPPGFNAKSNGSHGEEVGIATLLVCREYHRLAKIEDIQPHLLPYTPIDFNRLRAYWGEELFPAIYAENQDDCLAPATPEKIASAWPKIREYIADLPQPDALEQRLAEMGAKRSLKDINIPEDKLRDILNYSPYQRNRLTLMRIRRLIRE